MSLITIDNEKCTNCGICISECPCLVLKKGLSGPEATAPQYCIACGHCVAVCPNAAIDNEKAPLAQQTELKKIQSFNSEEALCFLRSRRSIRSYKNSAVSRKKLLQLVDIAHYAPTASNLQGISYIIVDNKEIIGRAVETEIRWMENDPIHAKTYAHFIKTYREDNIDKILHYAPALILATADKDFAKGRENTVFSLAYLELYAPSIGLGSCWAGIFERCALLDDSPMLELFNIPKNQKITGVVMVGYPKYSFRRMVERNPLNVTFY